MKKITMLLLAAMVGSVAFGGINLSWNSKQGFQSPDGTFVPQDAKSYRLVWDLVYTSGSSITAPSELTENATSIDVDAKDLVDYGTDVVLSRREWTAEDWNAGRTGVKVTDVLATSDASSSELAWTDKAKVSGVRDYLNYNNFSYTGGGVYMAVFQIMTDGTVNYGLSTLFKDGTDISLGRSSPDPNPGDSVAFNSVLKLEYFDKIQTVPEPATMSLLGLGALAMVIRRKLRK